MIKKGNVAVLFEAEDSVCFNIQHPDPVFVPAHKRHFLDVFLAGTPTTFHDREQMAFHAFLSSHRITSKDLETERSECLRKACQSCADRKHPIQRSSASMYLLLSHGCNQACIYCLNGRETYGVEGCAMMTDEIARKAIRQVASTLDPNGELEIVFFGGEPLLNWPLAKRIMDESESGIRKEFPSLRFRFHLTTNLTLFPPDLIDYAKKYALTFLVDVDGPPDIHDKTRPYKAGGSALVDTLRHVERLRHADIPVALRATVTSYNDARLLEVTRYHRNCGGTSSAFAPLNAVDSDGQIMPRELCPDPQRYRQGLIEVYRSDVWDIEQLHPFNEYARRFQPGYRMNHGCGAPYGNTPTITAEGKIFSCIYLVNNPQFEAGDIHANDFPREHVLEWMREVTDTNRHQCRDCVFQYLCGGGCPVGLFGILRRPDTEEWARHYTRDIACATTHTVLQQLLFDTGRATTGDIEHKLHLQQTLPVEAADDRPEFIEPPAITPELLWDQIQKEAIRERLNA